MSSQICMIALLSSLYFGGGRVKWGLGGSLKIYITALNINIIQNNFKYEFVITLSYFHGGVQTLGEDIRQQPPCLKNMYNLL